VNFSSGRQPTATSAVDGSSRAIVSNTAGETDTCSRYLSNRQQANRKSPSAARTRIVRALPGQSGGSPVLRMLNPRVISSLNSSEDFGVVVGFGPNQKRESETARPKNAWLGSHDTIRGARLWRAGLSPPHPRTADRDAAPAMFQAANENPSVRGPQALTENVAGTKDDVTHGKRNSGLGSTCAACRAPQRNTLRLNWNSFFAIKAFGKSARRSLLDTLCARRLGTSEVNYVSGQERLVGHARKDRAGRNPAAPRCIGQPAAPRVAVARIPAGSRADVNRRQACGWYFVLGAKHLY
jgi:hypothetical protein